MSGNLRSIPPPVLPPIVPSVQPAQNSQVYMKEISINKPLIFTGVTNRARKWLADIQVYLILNQAVYNNDKKRILFILSYMWSTDYNIGLSKAKKWADL